VSQRLNHPVAPLVTGGERLHWVDVAKAVAIVLVVLYHVSITGVDFLFPGTESFALAAWREACRMLLPIRMPLFFLVAGMLASGAILRPWKASWRSRFADILWPYLLWSLIFAGVAGFAYQPDNPFAYTQFSLATIPQGGTAYWFLPVLVVFFVLAKVLRPVASLATLGALVLLSVQSAIDGYLPGFVPDELAINIVRLANFALWYFLGCFAGTTIKRIAGASSVRLILGAAAIYAALTYLIYIRDTELPLSITITITGLICAITLSVWATRYRVVRNAARYMAARTLPIYLMHPVLLSLIGGAFVWSGGGQGVLSQSLPVLNAVAVPVLTVVITAGSLVAYDFLMRTPLRVLFQFPGAARVPVARSLAGAGNR
jgi:uncharacterized membrane protein YcfT